MSPELLLLTPSLLHSLFPLPLPLTKRQTPKHLPPSPSFYIHSLSHSPISLSSSHPVPSPCCCFLLARWLCLRGDILEAAARRRTDNVLLSLLAGGGGDGKQHCTCVCARMCDVVVCEREGDGRNELLSVGGREQQNLSGQTRRPFSSSECCMW